MKRILFLFAVLFLAVSSVTAQSYKKLWAAYQDAEDKDLPKTALEAVKKICEKAEQEKNAAQLIKGSFARYKMADDIAPDSGQVVKAEIMQLYKQETRPVEHALWSHALAEQNSSWRWSRRNAAETSFFAKEALKDLDALANAKYTSYDLLFTKGKDSKYYNNDLLHIFIQRFCNKEYFSTSERNAIYGKAIAIYRQRGNREGTLLMMLDSISSADNHSGKLLESDEWLLLNRMADQYRSLPLNVRTYCAMIELNDHYYCNQPTDSVLVATAERGVSLYGKQEGANPLRNFIDKMNLPSLYVSPIESHTYPGMVRKQTIKSSVIKNGEIRLYKLDGQDVMSIANCKNWRDLDRRLIRTDAFTINKHIKYRETQQDFELASPAEPGIYAFSVYDGKDEMDLTLVYCTRLKLIVYLMEHNKRRFVVVDTKSGDPILGAKVLVAQKKDGQYTVIKELTGNDKGEYFYDEKDGDDYYFFAQTADDRYLEPLSFSDIRKYGQRLLGINKKIYTYIDRGIYRPGQKVYVGGTVFSQDGDETQAVANTKVSISLFDANRQRVADTTAMTDDFGNYGAEFNLHKSGLLGTYRISATTAGASRDVSLEVQEYKRPTFTTEFEPVTRTYAPGDTVLLTGTVKTYTGLPVQGAKVHAITERRELLYWRYRGDELAEEKMICDTVTDADGHFSIPVIVKKGSNTYGRTLLRTEATVTSLAGESHSCTNRLYVSYHKAFLDDNWPNTICKEQLPAINIHLLNANCENIPAKGTYVIRKDTIEFCRGTFSTEEPLRLKPTDCPPSGSYSVDLAIEHEGEKYKRTIRSFFFSLEDKHPASNDVFWKYVKLNERGDSATVVVGSPKSNITMFYDVVTNEGLVESRRIQFTDTLYQFHLAYKPEYGDAARFDFAFVKDDGLYTADVTLKKPLPNKKIDLSWSTFRSELTPGQKEEWRLKVKNADGTPANAAVITRLYDASLDALIPYSWYFSHSFSREIPTTKWNSRSFSTTYLRGNYSYDHRSDKVLIFTHWTGGKLYGVAYYEDAFAAAPLRSAVREKQVGRMLVDEQENVNETKTEGSGDDDATNVSPRTNFNETAFFYPSLRTDDDGEVTINFTLPESLTQWNFLAFAHTQDMNYGFLSDKVVARKLFMVQPNMPRFVREGDKAQIPVMLTNIDEKDIRGEVVCQFLDADTQKPLQTLRKKFDLAAGKSDAAMFDIDVSKLGGSGVVICRITGKGGNFSDGEEHYLPILTSREQVISTLPFSMKNSGTETLKIDTLWSDSKDIANKVLTVEISSNPTWYVVNTLPVLADRECLTSDSWATRLYAVLLAKHIADSNPAIKKAFKPSENDKSWASVLNRNEDLKITLLNESPWVRESQRETERVNALASLFDDNENAAKVNNTLTNLQKLQNADGSWSWCPLSPGSPYITSRICVILARLQKLTGDTKTKRMFNDGMNYLTTEMHKYVEEMKKYKYKGCSYLGLNYLYALALTEGKPMDRKNKKDIQYLLERVKENVSGQDMYTKSHSAVVLSYYNEKESADIALQSLMEHTVSTPEKGRYFDTRRAPMTYSSYRIPSQTSTMEAITFMGNGKYVDELKDMRLWLMQSKRTQMWETSSSTLDATYALLLNSGSQAVSDLKKETLPVHYTLLQGKKFIDGNTSAGAKGGETVGYYCDKYTTPDKTCADRIELKKHDDGLSWGGIYASYTLPLEQVVGKGQGFQISRTIEMEDNGKWRPVNTGEVLKKGQNVRMTFTIKTERDFDYVTIRTGRAACLEPVDQISDYKWTSAGGAYREVRDADTKFFFEKFAKGTHVLTETMRIDRGGVYQCAPARIQCMYSPEYQAITSGTTISAE